MDDVLWSKITARRQLMIMVNKGQEEMARKKIINLRRIVAEEENPAPAAWPAGEAVMTADEAKKLTVPKLKAELTKIGLSTTGLKAVIQERLLDAIAQAQQEDADTDVEVEQGPGKAEATGPEQIAADDEEEAPAPTPPVTPVDAAAPAAEVPPTAEAAAPEAARGGKTRRAPKLSAKERMKVLNELLEDGLVTQDEYNEKRSTILQAVISGTVRSLPL